MSSVRPTVDPQWIRETLVEDRLAYLRSHGVDSSSSDVDRAITEELRLVDAYTRDTKPVAPAAKVPRAEPSNRAKRQATAVGASVYKRGIDESAIVRPAKPKSRRTAFLDRKPQNERQARIIARLTRIIGIKSKFRPTLTNDYEIPALADEWATLMVDLCTPRNDFVGKSATDSERMFWAKAERICDRSTGKLGPWWVK